MDWTKFSEYGLMGLVLGTIIFILYKMIVWVMGFVKEQAIQQAKEREAWTKKDEITLALLASLKNSIDLHNQQSADAHESIKGANDYQRREHERMIGQLNEISITLGRINGYKDQH